MNKVIYTALMGEGFKLNEPKYINKEWEFICFTDKNIKSKHWKIIKTNQTSDSRKKAREIKIRCDKYIDFDISIWIDAKFTIRIDLNKFISNFQNDLVLMDHSKRQCIYDEVDFCISKNIGNKNDLRRQINQYKKDGYPRNNGLYGTGVLYRKNNSEVINFMKLWYEQIEKYTTRDQVSFPYVLWKNPISITTIPFRETYARFK